ncbi:MAG: polyprenol monophosphomannose synthase [Bacteroidetes bacterium]|nr:polyprenol monophosphomannose synthase [Bacteroidota bacterium]MCB9227940.1 polyprenol monophosphomannose synthase [Chitinophagales bacterium]
MSDSLVIIPTYNEIENVEKMIRTVFALPHVFDVLIVDDNSPDQTANKVKELQKEFSNQLFLIERQGKLGLGTAYITGFKFALEKNYDYIFEMDCDFSHNPNDLIKLYEACHTDGYDVAVGSRYVSDGGFRNWPLFRVFLSKFASFYVETILSLGVKDSTAGFVCYTKKVLQTLDLDNIKFIGYVFQIEMKFKAKQHGFSIKEVPIIFTDRVLGQSKMSKNIINEAVWGVWKLRKEKIKS